MIDNFCLFHQFQTPSGKVMLSDQYVNGTFELIMTPETIEQGRYTCRIPDPFACPPVSIKWVAYLGRTE